MTSPDAHPFRAWLKLWMDLASYQGRDVPDPAGRTEQLIALWHRDIPGGWHRDTDARLLDPTVRYRRGDLHDGPRAGSEHELEYELLGSDRAVNETRCFDERLIDGINAVPLARDCGGRRNGNVEVDMLLLTAAGDDYRLLLVEAKTISNNAWYATVENLRQLRLFQATDAARQIMRQRSADLIATSTPVTAVVLAPTSFYTAPGARCRSVAPTQAMMKQVNDRLHVDVRLAVWDKTARTVAQFATRDAQAAASRPT